jgi:hypothetical protein
MRKTTVCKPSEVGLANATERPNLFQVFGSANRDGRKEKNAWRGFESGGGSRSPGRWRVGQGNPHREASWMAPGLWRFRARGTAVNI